MTFSELALHRAAAAIDSMSDAFVAVDHSWRVVLVNQKQESLFQRSRDQALGQILWDVFPEAAQGVFFDEIRRAASEKVQVEFEAYCGALDRWFDSRARPHDDGLDIFFRDVTARRRSGEDRGVPQRRDEVLSVVAHDLRNQLNTIRASSRIGLAMGDRSPRRPLETIEKASERMEKLVRDLLDVSAVDCGRLSVNLGPVRIAAVVSEALDAHATASGELGIGLSAVSERDLPDVVADPKRLVQVLGNLIGNAMKFTPRGGEIVVGAVAEGSKVRLWVTDTGEGIPLDQLPYVFNKFRARRSRPQEGVGLGLAICKAIVDAHGGRIWVESGDTRGTTVSFTVPVEKRRLIAPLHNQPVCTERHNEGSEKTC
jgi:signal transduction histidine kinase